MTDSQYPSGPLPTDLEATILNIIRDTGVSVTEATFRKRVEAHYKIEFTSHQKALKEAILNVLNTPEVKLLTAKAKEEREKEVGGKGKKRARSPTDDKKDKKKDKKDKKDKKEKKAKKEKKPEDYPKPALSSYFIFTNENRDRLRRENPDAPMSDIVKKLGEMWKTVSAEDQARLQKLADADKARHQREMDAYLAKGGKVFKRGSSSGKRQKREKPAVKRALSAYMYFAQDFRTKHSELSITDQMREAGAAWKKLTPEQRAPFEAKAQKDKERYSTESEAHKAASK